MISMSPLFLTGLISFRAQRVLLYLANSESCGGYLLVPLYFSRHLVLSNFPTVQPLNKNFVQKTPFSLTGVYMVPSVLQQGDWAIKLDLAHGKLQIF